MHSWFTLEVSRSDRLPCSLAAGGGAILKALEKLKADRRTPTAALCVIDRQTGGKEVLVAAGLSLFALLTLDEIEQVWTVITRHRGYSPNLPSRHNSAIRTRGRDGT